MLAIDASAAEKQDIRVTLGEIPVYMGGVQQCFIPVTVTVGDKVLVKDQDYTLTYGNNLQPTNEATVTVVGKGDYAGYEETFTFPILRRNIDEIDIEVEDVYFEGSPITPSITAPKLWSNEYVLTYKNNVNAGTGTVRVIGKGGYYGHTERQFQILNGPRTLILNGKYLGKVDGTLSEDYAYSEMIISPGKVTARVNQAGIHAAGYALYRIEGEEAVLVTEYTSEAASSSVDTAFTYDFSSIYEGVEESSGEVFLLSYSWVTQTGYVYAGVMLLAVPSRVGKATDMTLTHHEGLGDYSKGYLSVAGTDGALDEVVWTCSDPSVATVEDGIVTFRKPGTVTITAKSGDLVKSVELTANQQFLFGALLYDYNSKKGATVIYDNRILTEGTDYTLYVEQKDGQNIVTVTGCGLFKGQLVRSFDGKTGEGAEHTHTYAGVCETTCTGCKEVRPGGHSYSAQWSKDMTHHWHECSTCGGQTDKAEHSPADGDGSTCTVCGKLYLPGDFNGDNKVTDADVIYLLWHTVFPEDYPIK